LRGSYEGMLIGKGAGKDEVDATRVADDNRANLEQAAAAKPVMRKVSE
jgi:hypothetical protein